MLKKKLINLIKSKLFLPTALYVVVDIVLLAFSIFILSACYARYLEVTSIKAEIQDLKISADLIKGNKDLVQENIEYYNKLLDQLIPSDETYFNVISALDRLESVTGAVIHSYSINLNETTEKKLSLSLTVGGDIESVQNLLERYLYSSSRLITNQEFSIEFENLTSFEFHITMIHLPKEDLVLPDAVIITDEDVLLLEKIGQEI
jgi:hypothetical protein